MNVPEAHGTAQGDGLVLVVWLGPTWGRFPRCRRGLRRFKTAHLVHAHTVAERSKCWPMVSRSRTGLTQPGVERPLCLSRGERLNTPKWSCSTCSTAHPPIPAGHRWRLQFAQHSRTVSSSLHRSAGVLLEPSGELRCRCEDRRRPWPADPGADDEPIRWGLTSFDISTFLQSRRDRSWRSTDVHCRTTGSLWRHPLQLWRTCHRCV